MSFDRLSLTKSDSIILLENKISLIQDSLNILIEAKSSETPADSYTKKNQLAQDIAALKLVKKKLVKKKVKGDWRLVLGLVASPETDLNASNSNLITSFRSRFYGTSNEVTLVRDTIQLTKGESSFVRLPFSTGIGFSIQKGSQWLFCSDFTFQQWSRFSFGSINHISISETNDRLL